MATPTQVSQQQAPPTVEQLRNSPEFMGLPQELQHHYLASGVDQDYANHPSEEDRQAYLEHLNQAPPPAAGSQVDVHPSYLFGDPNADPQQSFDARAAQRVKSNFQGTADAVSRVPKMIHDTVTGAPPNPEDKAASDKFLYPYGNSTAEKAAGLMTLGPRSIYETGKSLFNDYRKDKANLVGDVAAGALMGGEGEATSAPAYTSGEPLFRSKENLSGIEHVADQNHFNVYQNNKLLGKVTYGPEGDFNSALEARRAAKQFYRTGESPKTEPVATQSAPAASPETVHSAAARYVLGDLATPEAIQRVSKDLAEGRQPSGLSRDKAGQAALGRFIQLRDLGKSFESRARAAMPEGTDQQVSDLAKTMEQEYAGAERRSSPRSKPLNALELETAIKQRKQVQTPVDDTEGTQEGINRDVESRVPNPRVIAKVGDVSYERVPEFGRPSKGTKPFSISAKVNGEIRSGLDGFVEGDTAVVDSLVTKKQFRNQTLGENVFKQWRDQLQKDFPDVKRVMLNASSDDSARFWSRQGFEPTDSEGRMVLELGKEPTLKLSQVKARTAPGEKFTDISDEVLRKKE